ncbi:MAG: RNA polymerase subunit sigma-70 [Ignavibacteriae bacterium]|nr:MAG: RNA polymerase subunit sigma-70 [Ignavibacteriota bacterium]
MNKKEHNNFGDNKDEDFLLIKKFNSGNSEAFTKLIYKHRDKIRNLVYLTLGDVDYVDDVCQDVLINVYHNISNFRFESKFTTWLYRITVNKCRDYLRKKKVRRIFVGIKENDFYNKGTRPNTDSVDIPNLVRKAIDKLPEKLKDPLILRDIEGFSYQEIAEKLNCEIGTIKSRIFRARENLKIILEPYERELKY